MKLFSLSIGLLLAALGVFHVPVSFAVDGFGLVVNPGGVRTIRASEDGTVLHFSAPDGRFEPGHIITVVTDPTAPAKNALELGTLQREYIKVESEHLEKTSKLKLDLERDRAKQRATAERLAARVGLMAETETVLNELRSFTATSDADIADLNAERLQELERLEALLEKSRELAAIPAQRLATMMDSVQTNRLSVITSRGATFSTDRMILDMSKNKNDLEYSISIDDAEIDILTKRIADLEQQIVDLNALRDKKRREAEARYLARLTQPQVAVASASSVDMRTLQASRADVLKADALRLLTTDVAQPGLAALIYGAAAQAEAHLIIQDVNVTLDLMQSADAMKASLASRGVPVSEIRIVEERAGPTDLRSVFVGLADAGAALRLTGADARDASGVPLMVRAEVARSDSTGAAEETITEIVGFIENRHAVVLRQGQVVRGSISDPRSGTDVVFAARVLDRDFSTVDTKELGIRLGNQSLAAKIIKRGVISQIVVGVDDAAALELAELPGAVVHLSFPLARQSLFSFLLARDAAI
jgi:hypothetical protein